MDISNLTATALSDRIRSGALTAMDAVEAAVSKIKTADPRINAFITLDAKNAYRRAEEVQRQIEEGSISGPLAGVPIAVKDNICTQGLRTSCASKILEHYVPTYQATAVENLMRAGMIVVGKTNMDEFAMGSTSETSYFGPVKNPLDTTRVPGGSSGGSCAAVAAGEVPLALGSDTGGSIRQPSAYCGVTGIKPTYGCVSRYGLIAYGSSLDQIGPIAGNVSDAAALLSVIASYDDKDATSMRCADYDYTAALKADVKGMRIGIPEDYFTEALDTKIRDAIFAAAEVFASLGATVERFHLGMTKYAIPAYYTIASAEASSNLERFDGVKYGLRAASYDGLHDMYKESRTQGFGSEVKRRIMLGSFVLSSGYYDAYYLKALRTKALIKQAFDKAFASYDLILSPAAPGSAPKLGASLADPLAMYLGDIYTVSANLVGIPGISLPCGTDAKGLPIGLQIFGDAFCEKKIIRAAYTYEQYRAGRKD